VYGEILPYWKGLPWLPERLQPLWIMRAHWSPRYYRAVMFVWFNRAPMVPTDASLSDGCSLSTLAMLKGFENACLWAIRCLYIYSSSFAAGSRWSVFEFSVSVLHWVAGCRIVLRHNVDRQNVDRKTIFLNKNTPHRGWPLDPAIFLDWGP